MMTEHGELEALREAHRRLRVAAAAVVDGTQAAGNPQRPMCMIEPHLVRRLRRELEHEPAVSGLAYVS